MTEPSISELLRGGVAALGSFAILPVLPVAAAGFAACGKASARGALIAGAVAAVVFASIATWMPAHALSELDRPAAALRAPSAQLAIGCLLAAALASRWSRSRLLVLPLAFAAAGLLRPALYGPTLLLASGPWGESSVPSALGYHLASASGLVLLALTLRLVGRPWPAGARRLGARTLLAWAAVVATGAFGWMVDQGLRRWPPGGSG